MGRKKKKTTKPWCWYCNREFEDDKILLQHQKAKHFKCHICHKKLFTGPGLQIHCMQVHKENIEKVPNSIKGRDNITLEICGMENIPEEDIIEHDKLKSSNIITPRDDDSDSDSEIPVLKQSRFQQPSYTHLQQQPPILPTTPQIEPLMHSHAAATTQPNNVNIPPNSAVFQQMMMMYGPQMSQMMNANPLMMSQFMSNQGIMQQPPVPQSQSQPNTQAPPQPQPLMDPTGQPQSLMSLIGQNAQPPPTSLMSLIGQAQPPPPPGPKPLFPSASSSTNNNEQISSLSHFNDSVQHFVQKIENAPPGSKIIHPDDDISLEEYRASHHKYRPDQNSSLTIRWPSQYAQKQLYRNNGNDYQ